LRRKAEGIRCGVGRILGGDAELPFDPADGQGGGGGDAITCRGLDPNPHAIGVVDLAGFGGKRSAIDGIRSSGNADGTGGIDPADDDGIGNDQAVEADAGFWRETERVWGGVPRHYGGMKREGHRQQDEPEPVMAGMFQGAHGLPQKWFNPRRNTIRASFLIDCILWISNPIVVHNGGILCDTTR